MTELGLSKGVVRLVDHQLGWAALAAGAIAQMKAVSSLILAAEHVGSTAISGLPAKPIIDIAVGIRDAAAVPELTRQLAALGYIYRGDGGEQGGHLFVRETAPDVRSMHVHVVQHGGRQWRNYLRFRDSLHADARLRESYAELKRRLASQFREDRAAYTNAKQEFVDSALTAEEQPQ